MTTKLFTLKLCKLNSKLNNHCVYQWKQRPTRVPRYLRVRRHRLSARPGCQLRPATGQLLVWSQGEALQGPKVMDYPSIATTFPVLVVALLLLTIDSQNTLHYNKNHCQKYKTTPSRENTMKLCGE